MVEPRGGEGERREAAVRRRRLFVFGALFAAGLLSGLYVGSDGGAAMLDSGARWSAPVSLGLAAIFLTAMIGGTMALRNATDELQREIAARAMAAAGGVFVLLYPLWFLLWKGGLLPEPMHAALFLVFWLTLALATLWYRFR
jgi:hypothetical protein